MSTTSPGAKSQKWPVTVLWSRGAPLSSTVRVQTSSCATGPVSCRLMAERVSRMRQVPAMSCMVSYADCGMAVFVDAPAELTAVDTESAPQEP